MYISPDNELNLSGFILKCTPLAYFSVFKIIFISNTPCEVHYFTAFDVSYLLFRCFFQIMIFF